MIVYKTFLLLYDEAKNYEDVDMYVAERGWQEWMNDTDIEEVIKILRLTFKYAHSPFDDVLNGTSGSRAALARLYHIPYRTLEDWIKGKRKPPEYVKELIYYVFLTNELMEVDENE